MLNYQRVYHFMNFMKLLFPQCFHTEPWASWAVSRWTRNLWVEARCWEQGAMWSWPSLCALQMERHGTYGTCGDCCGSTCASTCASNVPKRIWNWNSDSGGWSIFFSFLFSLPSVVICTVCKFPLKTQVSRACEAKVMESGTVGVVVQSINDGYDADIIQVLDGTKENPHPDISWLLCNIAR